VPQTEHARPDENDIPVAVDRLRQYLTTQLPDLLEWEIVPDRDFTVDRAAGNALRDAYDDLIAPFERAQMPLRVDGADKLQPRAKVWKWEEHLAGTFDLWLCKDPDTPRWIVVTVGLWTEPQLLDEEPAADLGHFGFTPHHPLLFLPRPPAPTTSQANRPSSAAPSPLMTQEFPRRRRREQHLTLHRSLAGWWSPSVCGPRRQLTRAPPLCQLTERCR
jgi:hypothetical protein